MYLIVEEIQWIAVFIFDHLVAIWPYLLLTVPLAVAVNGLGASKYIGRAFNASPLLAIFLAAAVGAFSPFCSCTVIPVVASLLLGGVPLAPVMAFWVASPSMDPEVFFLSVGFLGWEIAVWRLVATLALSLAAGVVTHLAVGQGWLGRSILRERRQGPATTTMADHVRRVAVRVVRRYRAPAAAVPLMVAAPAAPGLAAADPASDPMSGCAGGSCALEKDLGAVPTRSEPAKPEAEPAWRHKLWTETRTATAMVLRFMVLAFVLEALIVRYVPEAWIVSLLGGENPFSILWAALLGVPVYINNLAALALVGGLLEQGLAPGAALAFLIAGPMTTLPAMTAVWQLANRRVFVLYVGLALVGAVLGGILLSLFNSGAF